MPEGQEELELEFLSQLEIHLSMSGVENVTASLKEITSYEKDAISNLSKLKKEFGGLNIVIQKLIKAHKDRGKAAKKASNDQIKKAKELTKKYKDMGKAIGSSIAKMATFVFPTRMGDAVKTTLQYNKSLISTSASVNRLGIGLGSLETMFERVSKETTLTRRETVKLFDQYQEGMRFISMEQFEKMLSRIKDIVGADADAMGRMQKAVVSLSKEYPSLAAGLAEMEEGDKKVAKAKIRNLFLIGKITDAEYKQHSAFISGNKQMTAGEEEALKRKQDQIKAVNEFKRQWETAAIAIGKQLLPIIEKLAEWLKNIQEYTKDWEITLTKVVAAYAAIKMTGMIGGAVGRGFITRAVAGKAAGAGIGAGVGIGAGTAAIGASAAALIAGAVYSAATLSSKKIATKQAESSGMQKFLNTGIGKFMSSGKIGDWSGAGEAGDFSKVEARRKAQRKAMKEETYVSKKEIKRQERSKKLTTDRIVAEQKADKELIRTRGMGFVHGKLGAEMGLAEEGVKAAEAKVSLAEAAGAPKEISAARQELQYAKDVITVIEARQENITSLMAMQGPYAEKLHGLYKAQSAEVGALIEQMSITGDIDAGKIFQSMEAPLKTLKETIDARKTLIKFLEMEDPITKKKAMKEESMNKNRTKEQRAMFKIYASLDDASLAELDTATAVAEQRAKITDEMKEQTALLSQASGAYDKILRLTNAQATGAGLLVQLADNYAIGVGASMKVRMQEFNTLNDVISVLKDKLKTQKMEYAESVRINGVTEANKKIAGDIQETNNEIVSAMVKQASSVKAMRDGWVSAIGAMNAGFDGFSEIIMNADQNAAQTQQLLGAVRSSVSGALGRRGARGRILEDVGFRGTERINQFAQIAGRGGRRTEDIAYGTGRNIGQNEARAIEQLLRGRTTAAAQGLTTMTRRAVSGGMETQAAAGHKYTLSAEQAAGGTGTYGAAYTPPPPTGEPISMGATPINSVNLVLRNMTVHIDKINGLNQLATKFTDAAEEQLAGQINNAFDQFGVTTNV